MLGIGHLVLEAVHALPEAIAKLHRSFPVLTREDGDLLGQMARVDVPAAPRCDQPFQFGGRQMTYLRLLCNLRLLPIVAAGAGEMISVVEGGPRDSLTRVVRLGIRGDTVYDRAVAIPRRPVLPAEVDSAAKAQRDDPPPSSSPALIRLVDSLQHANAPTWWPAVQELTTGRDGTTWLLLHRRGGAEEWLVLDGAGAVLFPVRLPVGARLMVAGREMIWVFEPAADGGLQAVRYRVDATQ